VDRPSSDLSSSPAPFSSATDLLAALDKREVTSRELTAMYLERIARLDGDLGAIVTLDAERALAAAGAADDARAAGDAAPLLGLPITVKDCFEIEGVVTTCGLPQRVGAVGERDAPPVARLRAAGAVVLGTTNTPPILGDLQTANDVRGRTVNPWNASRAAGGSSGGSAAAVAAGLSALDLGSDLAGSIRLPAAWCGVYGLVPSYGIVSKRGHIPGKPSPFGRPDVSVAGPIARSVDDLELALGVLIGPEDEDAIAYRIELPPPRPIRRAVMWTRDSHCPLGPEMAAALDAAAADLEAAGVEVVSLDGTWDLDEWEHVFFGAWTAEITSQIDDEVAAASAPRVAAVHAQRHKAWLDNDERRRELQARMAALFTEVDALVCPVTPLPAIAHDLAGAPDARTIDVGGITLPYWRLSSWCGLPMVARTPAVSVPLPPRTSGLPLAAQVIGPYLEDRTALAAARLVATVSGGGYRVPPAW
jgi:amidase